MFIGLENINPESLQGAKKRQNKIWEYRVMLQAWRKQKVMTWAGYHPWFSDRHAGDRSPATSSIIKKELPLDILEFFFLTPLPGSEDHKTLYLKGVPMDPDMNNYDLEHVCTAPSADVGRRMEQRSIATPGRATTPTSMSRRCCKRAVVSGIKTSKIADVMTVFSSAARIEGVHPLQCGMRPAQGEDRSAGTECRSSIR